MNRLLFLGLLVLLSGTSSAEGFPVLREAAGLELEGRLGEALERYRMALSTETFLVQDERLTQPLTVRVYSKIAHLCIDLGYGEEAWDLGGRLLAAKNQAAAEAGTLVRLRLLRLQGRWAEGLQLFDTYAAAWPLPAPRTALLTEVARVKSASQASATSFDFLIRKAGGPAEWVQAGKAALLPSPTEAWGLEVQETVRLQLGAFQDWGNALTLIDILREKGWSPFTEVRSGPGGTKLHVVYLVSRQPGPDRARLSAQGITVLP